LALGEIIRGLREAQRAKCINVKKENVVSEMLSHYVEGFGSVWCMAAFVNKLLNYDPQLLYGRLSIKGC
jgi:hypothetical protein